MTDTDKDALILRLRTRLTIVEPVFRAAVAAHRNGAEKERGQFERIESLERAVDAAIDAECWAAKGHAIPLSKDLP